VRDWTGAAQEGYRGVLSRADPDEHRSQLQDDVISCCSAGEADQLKTRQLGLM
jgi:hypothetical protein